jgi:diguanylate cyclase (GGDEF)-like protein
LTASFLLLTAAALLTLGFLAFAVLRNVLRDHAMKQARETAMLVARVGVQSHLSASELTWGLSPARERLLDEAVRARGVYGSKILGLEVWNRAGVSLYTPDHRQANEQDYSLSTTVGDGSDNPAVRSALSGRTVVQRSEVPAGPDTPTPAEAIDVYVPLFFKGDLLPTGVARVELPYAPVAAAVSSGARDIALVLGPGLVVLYALLYRIVAGASRKLRDEARRNEHLALHDTLTDLPNRSLFHDRLDQAIRAAARGRSTGAVLVLDFDYFQEVNDTLGHDAGDRLLVESARRLQAVVRSTDTVARLGGDEFGVLLPEVSDLAGATLVVEQVQSALKLPVVLEGISVEAASSVGIALFPEHGSSPGELLQRADVAMHHAKLEQAGFAVYTPDGDRNSPRRLALLSDLRRALEENELVVHYQPIVDVESGRVTTVEALVRWAHPELGLVAPNEFIPLAERTGLIREVTVHVLDAALHQLACWHRDGVEVGLSVNLSARNLLDRHLPATVGQLLERHSVPSAHLQLELTENTIMRDPTRSLCVLTELRELGASLAIDDFGTGYSSLSRLKHLPVTQLKIDRSFVLHMSTDESDARIVQSTIDLGRNLGLRVVAEGVENEAVLAELAALGCQEAQGFHFSRPLPAGDYTRWHRNRGGAVPAGSRV